jgi:hypothetical protein
MWQGDKNPTGVTQANSKGDKMIYTMREARVGSKWASNYRPLKDIAADIRADVKAAKQAGDLPKDLKVSVRTDLYAGGGAIRVTLSGWSSDQVYDKDGDGYFDMTDAANRVRNQIEAIRGAYNRDASDAMVDYFDVTYYGSTDWDYKLRR